MMNLTCICDQYLSVGSWKSKNLRNATAMMLLPLLTSWVKVHNRVFNIYRKYIMLCKLEYLIGWTQANALIITKCGQHKIYFKYIKYKFNCQSGLPTNAAQSFSQNVCLANISNWNQSIPAELFPTTHSNYDGQEHSKVHWIELSSFCIPRCTE